MTNFVTRGCRCPASNCICWLSQYQKAADPDLPELPDGLVYGQIVGSFGCGILQDSSNLIFDNEPMAHIFDLNGVPHTSLDCFFVEGQCYCQSEKK